jgi:hypothetical protein
LEAKKETAFDNRCGYDKARKRRIQLSQDYANPKDPKFRPGFEIEPGMKDFNLRPKIDVFENPHGLSVFAARPKFLTDKENADAEKERIKRELL